MSKYRIYKGPIFGKECIFVKKYSKSLDMWIIEEEERLTEVKWQKEPIRGKTFKTFETVEEAEEWILKQKKLPPPPDDYIKEIEI